MNSGQFVIGEQLPLFQDKYMLLNGGSLELEKLNLHEAKKAFLRYKDLYKNGGNTDDELKRFVGEYLALRKVYSKEPTPVLGSKLFIRAIVLCDNESFMKLVRGIDFIDIRRQMKEINPSLFSRYMKHIESRNRVKG